MSDPSTQHMNGNYTLKRRTDPQKNDILIAIMGRSGHGKTSFLRCTAKPLEDVEKVDPSRVAPTQVFNFYRLHGHEDYQDRIVFIDTPAFDTNGREVTRSLADIIKETGVWIDEHIEYKNLKLAGIIYIYAFNDQHNSTPAKAPEKESPSSKEFESMTKLCYSADSIQFATWVWDTYPKRNGQETIVDSFIAVRKAVTRDAKYLKFSGDITSSDILSPILKNLQLPPGPGQDGPDTPSVWTRLGKKFKKLCCCCCTVDVELSE